MSFVVRVKYIGSHPNPPGVGYLDKEGRCTREIRYAQRYKTEADAWEHAVNAGHVGHDRAAQAAEKQS